MIRLVRRFQSCVWGLLLHFNMLGQQQLQDAAFVVGGDVAGVDAGEINAAGITAVALFTAYIVAFLICSPPILWIIGARHDNSIGRI